MRDAGDTPSTVRVADRLFYVAALGHALCLAAALCGQAGEALTCTWFGAAYAAACACLAADSALMISTDLRSFAGWPVGGYSLALRRTWLPLTRIAPPGLIFVPLNALMVRIGAVSHVDNFVVLTWAFVPLLTGYIFISHAFPEATPNPKAKPLPKDQADSAALAAAVPDVAVPLLFMRLYMFVIAMVFVKRERAQAPAFLLATSSAALFCMCYDKSLFYSPFMSSKERSGLIARASFHVAQTRCLEVACCASILLMDAWC